MPTPSLTQQINPPDLSQIKVIRPTLIVPETIYADPKFLSRLNAPIGVIGGQLDVPSLGNNVGTGVGPGEGSGYGRGKKGNIGDGENVIGGGGVRGTDSALITVRRDAQTQRGEELDGELAGDASSFRSPSLCLRVSTTFQP